jgi:DNA-binding HxlR family transcriptional regulator
LLIVLALSDETLRLNTLRSRLPGISSGVLDHHISRMVSLELLERQRFREMPPRVEVALTERGRQLLPIAAALARWGMRCEWPGPEQHTYAHPDAVLRQLPALLEESIELPDCIVEAVVGDLDEAGHGEADHDEQDRATHHWFEVVGGRLRAIERPTEKATARVSGDETAWTAALGPTRDYAGLRLGGEHSVAERLFDALPRDNRL